MASSSSSQDPPDNPPSNAPTKPTIFHWYVLLKKSEALELFGPLIQEGNASSVLKNEAWKVTRENADALSASPRQGNKVESQEGGALEDIGPEPSSFSAHVDILAEELDERLQIPTAEEEKPSAAAEATLDSYLLSSKVMDWRDFVTMSRFVEIRFKTYPTYLYNNPPLWQILWVGDLPLAFFKNAESVSQAVKLCGPVGVLEGVESWNVWEEGV